MRSIAVIGPLAAILLVCLLTRGSLLATKRPEAASASEGVRGTPAFQGGPPALETERRNATRSALQPGDDSDPQDEAQESDPSGEAATSTLDLFVFDSRTGAPVAAHVSFWGAQVGPGGSRLPSGLRTVDVPTGGLCLEACPAGSYEAVVHESVPVRTGPQTFEVKGLYTRVDLSLHPPHDFGCRLRVRDERGRILSDIEVKPGFRFESSYLPEAIPSDGSETTRNRNPGELREEWNDHLEHKEDTSVRRNQWSHRHAVDGWFDFGRFTQASREACAGAYYQLRRSLGDGRYTLCELRIDTRDAPPSEEELPFDLVAVLPSTQFVVERIRPPDGRTGDDFRDFIQIESDALPVAQCRYAGDPWRSVPLEIKIQVPGFTAWQTTVRAGEALTGLPKEIKLEKAPPH